MHIKKRKTFDTFDPCDKEPVPIKWPHETEAGSLVIQFQA